MRPLHVFLAGLLLAALPGCAESPADQASDAPAPSMVSVDPGASPLDEVFAPARMLQWKLPRRLREISGLALTPDDRLFAIADERAEIVELDYLEGRQVARFHVGDPAVAGDFEGLAFSAGAFHAITSDGVLLRFPEGSDRAAVAYDRFDTGLGERCEIEGLAADPDGRRLLIACKRVLERGRRGEVWLWHWDMAAARLADAPLVLDEDTLAESIDEKHFEPSGLAFVPAHGELIVVAARQRAAARIAVTGGGARLVEAIRLPARKAHRQTEGIAILAGGAVLLADEGGDGRGRLARYGPP